MEERTAGDPQTTLGLETQSLLHPYATFRKEKIPVLLTSPSKTKGLINDSPKCRKLK